MTMTKEIVSYGLFGEEVVQDNPYKKGVSHVAIDVVDSGRMYVSEVYFGEREIDEFQLGSTFILPIKEAKKRFRFIKENKLEKMARKHKKKFGSEESGYQRGIADAEYNRGWEETYRRAEENWDAVHGKGNWRSGW